MQGMRFLLVNEAGPINHGVIVKEITPEKYLCTFARVPQSSRVCDITEIQGWNLFPNDDQMNAFIASLQKQKAPPPPDKTPEELAAQLKKTAKKKPTLKKTVAKKRAKKKASAKK